MRKMLIAITLLCFLLINVMTVDIIQSILIGGNGVIDSISEAFNKATLSGLLFLGAFRAVPYLILLFFIVQNKLSTNLSGKFALWFALIGIAGLQAYGFWDVQYVFYTDQRVSSTHSIAYLWISLYSNISGLLFGLMGAFLGFLVSIVGRANSKAP